MTILKNLWNSWRKKEFLFQLKLKTIISKFYQTYPNLVICRQIRQMIQSIVRSHSAGAKLFECDISDKNENAPTKSRGIFDAFGIYRGLVIPIVAKSIINFNSYVRLYV